LQKLDNEASAALKHAMREETIDYQLVPPQVHHRNTAERAIRIFKTISLLAFAALTQTLAPTMGSPLLPQATTILNLLGALLAATRDSPQRPNYMERSTTNRTLLAPPGTKVIVHKTSSICRSWASHGIDGWFIGAAPHHYRCWRVFIAQTAGKRNSDTVKFFPATVPAMPQLSSADAATQAIQYLLQALKHPHLATPLPPWQSLTQRHQNTCQNICRRPSQQEPQKLEVARMPQNRPSQLSKAHQIPLN
jgi:hypothetical protein